MRKRDNLYMFTLHTDYVDSSFCSQRQLLDNSHLASR